MIALLQAVSTRAKALTDGTTFDTDKGGTKSAIAYHNYVMPPREGLSKNMPFCLVKTRGFTLHPSNLRQIELLYCLYQPDRAKAITDMAVLEALIAPMAQRGPHWATGWKLQSVTGWAGDRETGVQPHPEHYLTVLLDFVGP